MNKTLTVIKTSEVTIISFKNFLQLVEEMRDSSLYDEYIVSGQFKRSFNTQQVDNILTVIIEAYNENLYSALQELKDNIDDIESLNDILFSCMEYEVLPIGEIGKRLVEYMIELQHETNLDLQEIINECQDQSVISGYPISPVVLKNKIYQAIITSNLTVIQIEQSIKQIQEEQYQLLAYSSLIKAINKNMLNTHI